ncbi:MAG: DivIVA domain-containing protein [Bifidobacteriaceae bacterium]|jgi:DivIVA domain-containing protein|nr:DivIVA domain-containing protein [Bifidobacteriaceae bacterium]
MARKGNRLVTADEVVLASFRPTKFREGYDPVEVDDLLDTVAFTLRAYEDALVQLQDQAARDRQRIAQLESLVWAPRPARPAARGATWNPPAAPRPTG